MQATLVDFLENAFGVSAEEVARRLRTRPDDVLQSKTEVLGLLQDTWNGPSLEENRKTEGLGELWPRIPGVVTDVLTLADVRVNHSLRLGRPGAVSEAVTRDLQALLLYAHGLHVPTPFQPAEQPSITSREFLHAIAQLCSLAPLIRAGVVRVYEPTRLPTEEFDPHAAQRVEELKQKIGLALRSYEDLDLDQSRLYAAGSELVNRAISAVVEEAGRSEQGTLLFPTKYDRAALTALVSVFGKTHRPADSEGTADLLRLELLQALRLPGLMSLPLSEMIAVRSDTSFGIFRADVSSALREIDHDVQSGNMGVARRVMAEHMDAGVAKLNGQTRGGILRDVTLGNVVTWGIGVAAAGSFDGIRGLIAGLLGGLAVEYATESPTAGRRALRRHYVELGTGSVAERETVDFSSFSTDELWGNHRGRDRRIARRKAIIADLLEEFGDDVS